LRKALAQREAECADLKKCRDYWKAEAESTCACEFDKDENPINWCSFHDALRTENAGLREDVKKRINDNLELGFNYGLLKEENEGLRERVKELETEEFDPHEHPLLVQIEYLRSQLDEAVEAKDGYYELWQRQEPLVRDYRNKVEELNEQLADLTRQLNEPIHLGMFYNEEEGIKNIYILDKDGNETDREVKAECLLKRISKYFNRAKSAEWWMDHGQKLRNAIADCIPMDEPCGDQALIDYPAKMKAQLEEARRALEGEFDPHEHPLLVQIEYLRSKLEEVEEDKQKYYELWQNAIKQAALAGKEK
jgi:hypothetical protein